MMLVENISNKFFTPYNNAQVTKICKRCIFIKTNKETQGVVIKNISAQPGKYLIKINIGTGDNLYWYGTYHGYQKKKIIKGNNFIKFDISPQQKTHFDIGILSDIPTKGKRYKIFSISAVKTALPVLPDNNLEPTIPVEPLMIPIDLNYEDLIINRSSIDKNTIIFGETNLLDNRTKKISIVMGYYNRRMQLETTIKTIYKSLHKNFEIIVTDDASEESEDISDFVEKYDIQLIKVKKEEKTWINPIVAYNKAIMKATGDILIIQNPEVCHIDDIMNYTIENLNPDEYISFSCYTSPNFVGNEYINNIVTTKNSIDKNKLISHLEKLRKLYKVKTYCKGWYNHPKHRAKHYHFCAAVYRKHINHIRGFSAEFQNGHNHDDKDILLKIMYDAKLKRRIIDPSIGLVIHQYHISHMPPTNIAANQLLYKMRNDLNNTLYMKKEKLKKKIVTITSNIPFIINCYLDKQILTYTNYISFRSFLYYNPHWAIHIYVSPYNLNTDIIDITDDNYWYLITKIDNIVIHEIDFNKHIFRENILPQLKTEYFKLEILQRVGGLWYDPNIIFINSIENAIFANNFNHEVAFSSTNFMEISKFIVSQRNSKVISTILEKLTNDFDKNNFVEKIIKENNNFRIIINKKYYLGCINISVPEHFKKIIHDTIGIYFTNEDSSEKKYLITKMLDIINNDNFNKPIIPLMQYLKI